VTRRNVGPRARRLTHLDETGALRMVDVGEKPVTARQARALGTLRMNAAAFTALRRQGLAKGDALALARAAGIAAAKRTAEWIPLCHVVPLEQVDVAIGFEPGTRSVRVEVAARARWKTGVEMEAMVGAAAALLTLYDMAKALDRGMRLGPVVLLEKSGGRSGTWRRSRALRGTGDRRRR
jgi:cyclic pyranopterin monophosphate synthase